MKCIDCKHVDLQSHPAHSKTGFAKCKVEHPILREIEAFVSFEYERNCTDFEPAAAGVVAKRMAWRAKQ